MKPWQNILLGTILGLLVAGLVFFLVLPPKGNPVVLRPPPTPSPLVIHVDGAVYSPGIYELPLDSRIQDAIVAAGGFTETADKSQINLASKIYDGQKIYIPDESDVNVNTTTLPQQNSPTGNQLININLATMEELNELPGIGETKAQAIINYRESNGPFTELEDLLNVPGIGDSIFNQIKLLNTVK